MKKDLYNWLTYYIDGNYWNDENVPEVARSVFTTLCLTEDIIADTSECDAVLNALFKKLMSEDEKPSYKNFENFMIKFIV